MIYQSGFGRSRLPEANCLLLKRVVGRLSSCREARKDKNRQHLLVLLGVLQQSGEQRSLCECEQRQREQQQ